MDFILNKLSLNANVSNANVSNASNTSNTSTFTSLNDLENSNTKTPIFSLEGHKSKAKVVYIYDGDTVHLVIEVFNQLFKWKCRIAHVDTPELKTKDLHEKEMGYVARDKLKELMENKIVDVECFEFDKYGRLLVEITVDGIKVHEWLISNGYAKSYEGKTKEKWN
jgi:endonuclease YncB( thermonuclease family)